MPLTPVRLRVGITTRGGGLYNAGEVASLPDDLAERLLGAGLAERYDPVADAEAEEEETDMARGPAKTKPKMKARPDVHKQVKWAPNKGGRP